jgi:hypothetical protein
MMNLAIWLKKNGFRADQVQTFYPSPMATATAMYHSGRNTLTKVRREMRDEQEERVDIVRGEKRRRLHKAFLRYHDPNNWPLLREALKAMGRADLIGNGKQHLIPTFQPLVDGSYQSARKKNSTDGKTGGGMGYTVNKDGKAVAVRRRTPDASAQEPRGDVRFRSPAPKPGQMLTQHTGLPPRAGVKPKGPGKPTFKAAGKPASKPGAGRKPR